MTGIVPQPAVPESIAADYIHLKKLKKSKTENTGGATETMNRIADEVAKIYSGLDGQLRKYSADCSACGKCCDFASFGHKLFVSSAEMVYLNRSVEIKPMLTARCPYQAADKCTIHPHRFAACRIFFCKADELLQNELGEQTLKKLKSLCEKFNLPYRYTDLAVALNNPSQQLQPPHP